MDANIAAPPDHRAQVEGVQSLNSRANRRKSMGDFNDYVTGANSDLTCFKYNPFTEQWSMAL